VREALQQLRGEGFVIMEPNRGARVLPRFPSPLSKR
jgi:DNA-binding GntR family transcriptional regulator